MAKRVTIKKGWEYTGECIEMADGSFDAVYSNDAGDVEWKPATPAQIAAYKRHKEWMAQGCPDIVIRLTRTNC